MTAQIALSHKFFKTTNKDVNDGKFLYKEILKNLLNFQIPLKFKKLILGSLIETLEKNELRKLNETFNAIDLDHEGFISQEEFKKAFDKSGIQLTDEEVANIFDKIDNDKNGKLNYSEFLIAAVSISKTMDHERLKKVFEKFDTDNCGMIGVNNIMQFMLRSGKEIENKNEAEDILKEVCKDESVKLNYEEFYQIMTNT
jgi:Ca2+-binding EF-hand superfamily protein